MKTIKQYLSIASSHCKAADFESALPILKESLQYYPSNPLFMGMLASCYGELGMPNEAIGLYEEIISDNPTNYLALHQLGLIYFQLNQFEKALKVWSPVITQPKDFVTKYYAAVATFQLGDLEQSALLIQAAYSSCPSDHSLLIEIERFKLQLNGSGAIQ